MEEDKIVKCIIELNKIFFPKNVTQIEGGGYGIFSADIIKKGENCEPLLSTIKLKGKVCHIEYCEKYNVSCKLSESHEKYGDTYEIVFINRLVDLGDKVKQRNFLMNVLNENTVTRLFDMYEDVVGLLEERDVKSLCKVKGIGTSSAMRICDRYDESKDYSEIYTELGHLGLTTNLIKKLVDYYKSPDVTIDVVKTNPYALVNVDGIGFKKADEIAEKIGISGSNPNRIKGCILFILNQEGETGRSYLHHTELMSFLFENIGYVEQDIINSVAKQLITNKEVEVTNNGEYIGLKKFHQLELDILDELNRLKNAEPNEKFDFNNWKEDIKTTEEEQGFDFTEEQLEAIELFTKSNIMALTGLAGAGKSATAKGMTDLVNEFTISACALSGKASVRITEATGIEASTIHRLLGYQEGHFMYNKSMPLDTNIVLIDEATMISGELFLSLLQAIPNGAKVIMMGDVQQLTPIGSCQVFADVLSSSIIPIYKLTKPHRQAMRSGIIPTSLKIANQEQIFESTFEGNVVLGELQDMELDIFKNDDTPSIRVVNHFMKHYRKSNNLMETQIIVPTKKRGDMCTYNLNIKVQKLINPIREKSEHVVVNLDKDRYYIIQIGDKVINTKNNYSSVNEEGDKTPVFNGNMGIVRDIKDGICTVDFIGLGTLLLDSKSCKSLELGYAITVHKGQGAGFDVAIGGVDSSAFMLLNAELLYTLLTRAKKYCVLVGKNTSVRTAINKREVKNKQTYLGTWLTEKQS